MLTNQMSVIGPKNRPIPSVPRRWSENKMSKISNVVGTTACVSVGEINAKPSTADKTEIAGVMTPSP